MSELERAEVVPMVDAEGFPTDEYDELEEADIIASGYEFDCEECGTYNTLISIPKWGSAVKCRKCGTLYKSEQANHAID